MSELEYKQFLGDYTFDMPTGLERIRFSRFFMSVALKAFRAGNYHLIGPFLFTSLLVFSPFHDHIKISVSERGGE